MGTWGPGIFSDDTAGDVRDAWREALMDGLEGDAATARVFEQLGDAFDDPDDGVVAWTALAAAQMQTGRLQPAVRDRVLAIIEAGGDLELWSEEPTFAKQRAKALAKLAAKLRGPQPPPKTLNRPQFRPSPLDVGDVVHVRGDEGEGLLVVVDHWTSSNPPATNPVLAQLLWDGGEIPVVESLKTLPLLHDEVDDFQRELTGAQDAGPVQHLWHIDCPTRGEYTLKHYGEVVARGVLRPDAADHTRSQAHGFGDGPIISGGGWDTVSWFVRGQTYDHMAEITRRVYGL